MSLDKELEKLTGAYCEDAPNDAAYPYKVFSARRLSESEGKQNYILEINVWDQNAYYSRAQSIMEQLEKELHRCNYISEDYLIRIFKGQSEKVTDQDKDIKRVREQFEMFVYEREGQ